MSEPNEIDNISTEPISDNSVRKITEIWDTVLRRKGWKRFRPKMEDWGFIPSSLAHLPTRIVTKYGKPNVHYAEGWKGLYLMRLYLVVNSPNGVNCLEDYNPGPTEEMEKTRANERQKDVGTTPPQRRKLRITAATEIKAAKATLEAEESLPIVTPTNATKKIVSTSTTQLKNRTGLLQIPSPPACTQSPRNEQKSDSKPSSSFTSAPPTPTSGKLPCLISSLEKVKTKTHLYSSSKSKPNDPKMSETEPQQPNVTSPIGQSVAVVNDKDIGVKHFLLSPPNCLPHNLEEEKRMKKKSRKTSDKDTIVSDSTSSNDTNSHGNCSQTTATSNNDMKCCNCDCHNGAPPLSPETKELIEKHVEKHLFEILGGPRRKSLLEKLEGYNNNNTN